MCWPACSRDCCIYSWSFERCPPFYKTVGRKICCRLHHALVSCVVFGFHPPPLQFLFFFMTLYNNWNRRVYYNCALYIVIALNLAGIHRWISHHECPVDCDTNRLDDDVTRLYSICDFHTIPARWWSLFRESHFTWQPNSSPAAGSSPSSVSLFRLNSQ
jgi:hypothetical protein